MRTASTANLVILVFVDICCTANNTTPVEFCGDFFALLFKDLFAETDGFDLGVSFADDAVVFRGVRVSASRSISSCWRKQKKMGKN